MEFQKFLLEDYMLTKEGRRITRFFKDFERQFDNRDNGSAFYRTVDSWLTLPGAREAFNPEREEGFEVGSGRVACFEDFASVWSLGFDDEYAAHDTQMAIPYWSVMAATSCPEYGFPYLFPREFYKFRFICDAFGIPLPVLPPRKRYSERCNYYLQMCRALYDFRVEHELSPVELWVFLYGFAPRFLGPFVDNSYGEPNRVYIVGATRWDVEEGTLKSPTDETTCDWQGNVEMLPGDIVIMYETSPYSRIRSIWRAVSPGFDDPFRYYPGAVFLGHPVMVPAVGIADLRGDAVWSKKGLVRASMQGVNGVVCSVDEYDALKKIFKRKEPKFSLKNVPTPPPYSRFYHDDLKVERDVEVQLLEPLLKKLGFTRWVRQLPLRMGRGDRVFPDYALGVKGRGDDAAAEFVWEAKYRIPTQKQLKIDFGQAKSYALRLQSKALGLIAIEGVWFVTAKDEFRFERLKHFTWEQLGSPDALAELRKAFR